MVEFFIVFINILADIFVLLVIASILLSYFMSPYHPVRRAIDQIVEPFLTPIRRVVPLVGMFDFSPLVLIVLVQILNYILVGVLSNLR